MDLRWCTLVSLDVAPRAAGATTNRFDALEGASPGASVGAKRVVRQAGEPPIAFVWRSIRRRRRSARSRCRRCDRLSRSVRRLKAIMRRSTIRGSTSGLSRGRSVGARPLRRQVDPFGNWEHAAVSPRLDPQGALRRAERGQGFQRHRVSRELIPAECRPTFRWL